MGNRTKKNVGVFLHSRGATFRVWAPFADSVAVTGSFNDWQETAMDNEDDGYWSVQIKNAQAGQEYKFIIRNGDQLLRRNDPRALELTTTDGNSVIVDRQFDWGDDDYTLPPHNRLVVYEMLVGTYYRPDPATTGTFENAIEKLDHLADMGINAIELMPIGSIGFYRGWWGYVVDYIYAIERLYGGRHQFLEFVKAAHQRGIGVLVDVVYNHFGPQDTHEGLDLWRFDGWYEQDGGGIYFYNDWRGVTPWGDTRPDYGRPEVRQFILDNVRMWMHDCHVDGLRIDSTIFMRNVYGRNDDESTALPEAWSLLQSINSLSHTADRSTFIIGEDIAANEYITKPIKEGGAGFDAQWQVTMPHAFRQALVPDDTNDIDLSGLLAELPRFFNEDPFQRVIYCDSHDSAANGAARLNEEIHPGHAQSTKAQAKTLIAAGIILTAPGVPMILQGQELMEAGDFTDWAGIDWQNAEKQQGIVQAYRHLIDLRKDVHGVSAGLTGKHFAIIHTDEDNKVIAYHRWSKGGPKDDVVIIANFANRTHKEYALDWPRKGTWQVRFNSSWQGYHENFKYVDVPVVLVDSVSGSIVLPPTSILVLSQDD